MVSDELILMYFTQRTPVLSLSPKIYLWMERGRKKIGGERDRDRTQTGRDRQTDWLTDA